MKLSPAGKLLWYYQLTPHDLYNWDLQDPPVLSTVHGQPVVIDGGNAGILIELSGQTGKLLWKVPVGLHNGHDHDGLLTENAKPTSHISLPRQFCLEPGVNGGIETQLASAPVTVDGDYVIAGAGVPLSSAQQPQIIAYKLGATGKLSDTVGS